MSLSPGPGAKAIAVWGDWLFETPLGWPGTWVMLGICGLAIAKVRALSSTRRTVFALAVSALSLEASFRVISIASDLRYNLWPMTAVAVLTALLLAEARPSRRALACSGAILLAATALGTVGASLCRRRQAMLGWAQGAP